MNEDQTQAAQALLSELWQGDVSTVPQVAAFDAPPVCAGCGIALSPDVLIVQPMATYCHRCRGDVTQWIY